MMHDKMRRADRGVVLIVVVGVLAILSLLAATFGMIARVELAASRNQTEYEMARQAAHDGAEALINALQTSLNGSSMTSGALPDFFPNTGDTDGMLLYRRDGVKVYFADSSTVPTLSSGGSGTPDWMQGLGGQDAGMFNINAMGFANDLGSNCNPDIRYTSFDCSLVRLLTSRFDPGATTTAGVPMSSVIGQIDGYRLGYTSFNNANERQRVAILLSRWIINWRHGSDGLPGTAGTEERRVGHLPRWSSRLNWIPPASAPPPWNDDVGIGYPATGNWGLHDLLPSLFINVTDLTQRWSYAEPRVWTSYLGPGTFASDIGLPTPLNWGTDLGLPVPGLFWGKVAPGLASSTTKIYADTSQPGWRDWPLHIWKNDYVYIATGSFEWARQVIFDNDASSLTFTTALAPTMPTTTGIPNPGDAFCIFAPPAASPPPPASFVGVLNKRWSATDVNPEGDLVPNAMLWPDGTLATEGYVLDRVLYSGPVPPAVVSAGPVPPATGQPFLTDPGAVGSNQWNFPTWITQFPGKSFVVHIYGGNGRGQVRTISTYSNSTLTLANAPPWTIIPDATSQYRIELADDNLPSKFQPNNLQGDDRLYLSLGDLYNSVVVPALASDGLSTANAQAVANILMPYFLPYLTVSTQAIQASQSLCSINDWAVDGVDNDSNGVVDDPGVWPTGEAQHEQNWQSNNLGSQALANLGQQPQANGGRQALALALYKGLGLYTWAHAGANATVTATRIPQAAQLVANIIDFRDPTDIDTVLTNANLNEPTQPSQPFLTNSSLGTMGTSFTVYGAKGLHVTQVMPSPDAIYSTDGTEMTDDGGTHAVPPPPPYAHDMLAWDWRDANNVYTPPNPPGTPVQTPPPYPPNTPIDQPCWQVMDNTNPKATFKFDNLIPGYYALRLIGAPQNTIYTVTYTQPWPGGTTKIFYAQTTTADPDTTYYSAPGTPYWYTGFVRDNSNGGAQGSGPLACFEVVSDAGTGTAPGSLSFKLQASAQYAQFRGFALCAQYVQLTNIATHDINLTGWTVATDHTTPATQTLPGITIPAITIPATYLRAADGKTIHTDRIHGAVVGTLSGGSTASTTTFPINYGTYVICMCEEAYERQWTARSGDPDFVSANGDGLWGDAGNEVCALFPYGDCPNAAGVPCTTAVAQNNATMALLLGVNKGPTYPAANYTPAVMVNDPAGDLIAGNLISATQVLGGVDGLIPPVPPDNTTSNPLVHTYCYSSIEKTVLLQPTWDQKSVLLQPLWNNANMNNWYWAPCWNNPNTDGAVPTHLVAYQNVLATVPTDQPRIPVSTKIRTYLNRNYAQIWNTAPLPTSPTLSAYPIFTQPSNLVTQSRVFPIILNRPYPTTGWLGLVPTSNTDAINSSTGVLGSWRTIDPNPNPVLTITPTSPATPEQLLGTLMSNATVGGVYARFNINTAPPDTLKAVFPDAAAQLICTTRAARFQGMSPTPPPWYASCANPVLPALPNALANASWSSWDELLNDPIFQYARSDYDSAHNVTTAIGYYDDPGNSGISNADAGAGTYADGFPDSSNEKKEWFMRFSNLFCLQSTAFRFTVAGLVYKDQPWDSVTMENNRPVAMVRIEMEVDLSNPASGPQIVHFRYLTQQ